MDNMTLSDGGTRPSPSPCTVQQEDAITAVVRAVVEAKTTGVINNYGMEACAGSGKTSTLVAMIERLHQVDPTARVLVLAFNVDAAAQLRHRLQPLASGLVVDVFTLHAYGMRILGAASTDPIRFDPDKMLCKWQNMPGRTPASTTEWRRIRTHIDNARRLGSVPGFQERPLTLDDAVLEVMINDRHTIDQDDQIYQCLVQQLTAGETYDLVLVDEAQDLNTANISFLRTVVAPLGTRTVLCAVGDPAQAIYAFRGADPDALQRYGAAFMAQWLHLTCCFRCPRRIVFLASHLCSAIRHQPNAPVGSVRVLVTAHPWQTLLDCVSTHQKETSQINQTLFLARNNRTLLAVLGHIYQTVDCVAGIHWLSPGIARELRILVEEWMDIRLGERFKMAALAIEQHTVTATERIMHSILEMAIQFEGVERQASESPWLQWLVDVLDSDNGRRRALTVGTIHAVKGEEWPHVVIHDFNMFGKCEENGPATQDRNLLYIAITRAQQSLTFLLNKRTKHIRSHLLPIDIVHYSGELWTEA